ncbi:MAG: bifunctional metallophosphatase/5'-nucleotidase [Deltaproteobacteria bacterium]|nr:bifunctional metallophosphatase/5'-nucleotidase [Deltaproteobacteria bacterium]
MRLVLVAGWCVSISACLWEGESPNLNGVDTRVTFLHTSDIHSRLLPFELAPTASDNHLGLDEGNAPFGGGARLAYLIKRERGRADRVMHVDSGDPFQGAPIFNDKLGEVEMRFMSNVGVDVVVTGNHEFDAGPLNYAKQLVRWATFPNLAANYIYKDPDDANHHLLARLTQPYTIVNLDGLRVGLIGMGDMSSLSSIGEGGNSLQITPTEQNETVRQYVNLLHGSVDLIVIVSHLGLTDDQRLIAGYEEVEWADRLLPNWEVREDLGDGRVVAFIPGVRGIDIIFGGHLHVVLNPPKAVTDVDGREVLIVHSGAFAKYLGRLDVMLQDDPEFGGKRVVSNKYQIFPVDNRLAQLEDPQIAELIEPYRLALNEQLDLRRVIAYAPRTILRRSQGKGGDSGLGNLVTESMRVRRRAEAEVAVTNTLGIRDNFYRGPITLEDMFNVFPFENTLTIMYLSGLEMQELCDFITERSASRGCQAQAQTAGLKFTMNCGQVLTNNRDPAAYAHPAEGIKVNDQPLDPSATYKIAVNDYIANGGSGFKVLKRNTTKLDTGVPLRTALVDYLGRLAPCGVYEAQDGRTCTLADPISKATCAELVDCAEYIRRCRVEDCCATAACSAGGERTPAEARCFELERLPRVCLAADDPPSAVCHGPRAAQTWTGAPLVKGPYAGVACVFGTEDGRIVRRTGEGLDQLPDYNDPEWGQ